MSLLSFSIPSCRVLLRHLLLPSVICLCFSVTAFSRSPRAARGSSYRPALSSHRLAALDPVARKNLDAALRDMKRHGLRPRLTTTFRSQREQSGIYRCYHRRNCRSRRGIYRAARPGTSLHEAGLAVDVAGVAAGNRRHRRITRDGKKIVRIMQKHGFKWPHGMRDPVHFEISPRQAGYRTHHAAIKAGQQRWSAQNRAASHSVRKKGQRATGRNHPPDNRVRLQKASYHPRQTGR